MRKETRRATMRRGAGLLAAPLLGEWKNVGQDDAGRRPARIKVGQIGVGHGDATKISVYRNSPDWEVVGIVEPDERLREAAQANNAYRGLR